VAIPEEVTDLGYLIGVEDDIESVVVVDDGEDTVVRICIQSIGMVLLLQRGEERRVL
jgi:hypothetical protein